MLFIEVRFFVFFLVVFGVHWALRTNTARKVWLLCCSHFFYACFFIGDPGKFLRARRTFSQAELEKGSPSANRTGETPIPLCQPSGGTPELRSPQCWG